MSKLQTAFTGAAKNITNKRNLIGNGVALAVGGGLCLAFGLAAFPGLLYGVGLLLAYDGIEGGYKALKSKLPTL